MDDLIRRHLVRLIESDNSAYPQVWNEDYEKGFCDAIKRVLDLPSAQQWIPCSERLPEPWTSVLVTYIYNGKRFVEESQYTGQDDERGNPLFSSYADEYKVSNAYFQKIAWMPLPEPYKGEE